MYRYFATFVLFCMFTTDLLALLHKSHPDTVAIRDGRRTVTVGDLLTLSARLAAGLRRIGVAPGDTAVLAAKPDADFIALVYAALRCGLRLAVIDPEMGRDNYREKLRQLSPDWAFVDSRLLLLQEHPLLRRLYFRFSKNGMYFPEQPGLRMLSTGPRLPLRQPHTPLRALVHTPEDQEPPMRLPDETEFLITYTSGTTQEPKGVVHSVGALYAGVDRIATLLREGGNKSVATHLPYFALIGLNAGVEAHLWAYKSSAAAKIRFIEQHKITTLFSPPCDYLPLIAYCEQERRKLPACLRQIFFGSAPVYRAFLERLLPHVPAHVRLTCLYGMTENLLVAAIDGRDKANFPTDAGDIVGRPVPGVSVKIASDGEIMLHSPQTYSRYLHLDNREVWHASGDLGYLREDGSLVLTGRKKDMIIRRNFNLYPGLYEPTINRIPGVTESAFIGIYDPVQCDETVVLVVETHQHLREAALRRALEFGPYSIDREAWPDRIVFATLPRKGRQSKVDKQALRALYGR